MIISGRGCMKCIITIIKLKIDMSYQNDETFAGFATFIIKIRFTAIIDYFILKMYLDYIPLFIFLKKINYRLDEWSI